MKLKKSYSLGTEDIQVTTFRS